jgi:dethiobiotin synthetase
MGMKPIAAGCQRQGDEWINEDVQSLVTAPGGSAARELVNPYLFREAIAPHLAAERKGVRIEIPRIVDAYAALASTVDVVLVEGVGGFLVPIDARHDTGDLALALGLPVILVVAMRLGCLNHALLTMEAVTRRGLRVAGWVANSLDREMLCYSENLDSLQHRLAIPLVAEFPFQQAPVPSDAVRYVVNQRLQRVLQDAGHGRG